MTARAGKVAVEQAEAGRSGAGQARGARRLAWLAGGYAALGLGLLGVVLPVLPTTPFMLVAAGCFAKASPRLHGWLIAHPLFGPPILDWQRNGAIRPKAKALAVGSMLAVLAASLWAGAPVWVLALQAGLMAAGAGFVLTRPSGPRD